MSKSLGFIQHEETGETHKFYDKDVNGYCLSTIHDTWTSGAGWHEVGEVDPLTEYTYKQVGERIGALVDQKNQQYGDSFNKSGDYLSILYPNGIQPHQYRDMLALVRDFDKSMRIAHGNQGNENAWNDKTGYGILMSGE